MTQALDYKGIDELFFNIIRGLLSNIITKSDDAAEKILALSSEIVSQDIQEALEAFHSLYHDNSTDLAQTDYNQQVDDIIDAHQDGNVDDQVINALDDTQTNNLAELQQKLEKAINSDATMKAKTAPILCAIQFSELMHRHVSNIEFAWQECMTRLESDDCLDIAHDIESKLNTSAERQAFNEHVLHKKSDITDDEDIDNLLDSIIK